MAGDTDNPRIWAGADVLVAPLLSTAPTDVTTPWDAAFESLGLLSEDGMEQMQESEATDYFAHGGAFIRNSRSKFKKSIKVICLEDNATVFGLVNPGSTSETDGDITTRTVKTPVADARMFGIELVDGDVTKRIVIPRGEVTEVGSVKISDADMTAYELTIAIYSDADNEWFTEITDDPQAIAPT